LSPHAHAATERPFPNFTSSRSHRNVLNFGAIQSLIFVKKKVARSTYDKIEKSADQILGLN